MIPYGEDGCEDPAASDYELPFASISKCPSKDDMST
jgi:hypothetical protein